MGTPERQQIMAIIQAESLRQDRGESPPQTGNPLVDSVTTAAALVNQIMTYPHGAIHCLANFYTNHAAMRCIQAEGGEAEHCGTCKQ